MTFARPLAAAAVALLVAGPACGQPPIKPADATKLAQSFLASLQAQDAPGLAALMDVPFHQLGAWVAGPPALGGMTKCRMLASDDVEKQKLAACLAKDTVSAHMLPNPIPGTWSIVKASEESAWLKQQLGADSSERSGPTSSSPGSTRTRATERSTSWASGVTPPGTSS